MKNWIILAVKILSDIVLINCSFVMGYMIRFGGINPFGMPLLAYNKMLIFVTITWLVIFNLTGLYKMQGEKQDRVDGPVIVTTSVFSASFFTYVIILSLYKEAMYSKDIIIYTCFIAFILLNISRSLIWYIGRQIQSKNGN